VIRSGRDGPLALAWSGGKDSVLALQELIGEHGVRPAALITTYAEAERRVSHHGVPLELIERQAAAVSIPLVPIALPDPCPNAVYEARVAAALERPGLAAIERLAFGDLFLEDLRAYREERIAGAGREAVFPLWGRATDELAGAFLADGFRAVVCAVDTGALDAGLAGAAYDREFVAGLPAGVDPCGENGEFHTFVYDGPVFGEPVRWAPGPPGREGALAQRRLLAA
jgi:uncharacterized protein (TIGR00290 family)